MREQLFRQLRITAFTVCVTLLFASFQSLSEDPSSVCLSSEEMKLYELINQYRAQKKLPAIPLSKSLTQVAQVHCKDLEDNKPVSGKCNMHSWSNKGKWKSVCYTADHKNAKLMWSKPSELTAYKGNGYEIAYQSGSGATAASALAGWKKSSGHNAVITNGTIWKTSKWKAIGIGIYGQYACVWFGEEEDPAKGAPPQCAN